MLPESGPGRRIAAGTGHRPEHIPRNNLAWTRHQINLCAFWLAEQDGIQICLSGMARGFDMWWAAACLRAGMKLWAAIPFEEQPARWSDEDQREWKQLRSRAEHEVVVGSLDGLEGPRRERRVRQLLAARNQLMAYRADFLACCWSPDRVEHSGTYQTIRMANLRRELLPGVHINPVDRTITHHLPALATVGGSWTR